jgi:hypothetical protein
MWNYLRDWAQIAPLLTPVVALIAVIFAWLELRLNRANQRETTAKATFREFLKICVQNPDLAYGKSSPDKQNEYEWFVAYFHYGPPRRFWNTRTRTGKPTFDCT